MEGAGGRFGIGRCTTMIFELWRQDDNGNRFLVGIFTDRAAAERKMAELARVPHKQTYWVAEKEP